MTQNLGASNALGSCAEVIRVRYQVNFCALDRILLGQVLPRRYLASVGAQGEILGLLGDCHAGR